MQPRLLLLGVAALLGGLNGVVVARRHPSLPAQVTDVVFNETQGKGHHQVHNNNADAEQGTSTVSNESVGIIVPLNPSTVTASTSGIQTDRAATASSAAVTHGTMKPSSSRAIHKTVSSAAKVPSSTVSKSEATVTIPVEVVPSGSSEASVPVALVTAGSGAAVTVTEGGETFIISEIGAKGESTTTSAVVPITVSVVIVSSSSTVTVPPHPSSSKATPTAPGNTVVTVSGIAAGSIVTPLAGKTSVSATSRSKTSAVSSAVAAVSSAVPAAAVDEGTCQCSCACPSGFTVQESAVAAAPSAVSSQTKSSSATGSSQVDAATSVSADTVSRTSARTEATSKTPLASATSTIQAVSTTAAPSTETSSKFMTSVVTSTSSQMNINTIAIYSALTIAFG